MRRLWTTVGIGTLAGAVLTALLAGACTCNPGPNACTEPFLVVEGPITSAQHERLAASGGCDAVCRELVAASDAGSGTLDAGRGPSDGQATCALDRPASEEILTCSFRRTCPL